MGGLGRLLKDNLGTMRQALAFAWEAADRRVKLLFTLAASFVLLGAAAASVSPVLLKLLVDGLSGEADTTGTTPPALAQLGGWVGPVGLVALYVISQAMATVVAEIQSLLNGKADQRLRRSMSGRILDHILRLPLRFHLNRQTGGVSQILANALTGYRLILQQLVLSIAPVLFQIGLSVWVLAALYPPQFTLILAAASVAYIVVFLVGAARLADAGRQVSSAEVEAYAILTDTMLNYETVKFCTAEELTQQRYDGVLKTAEGVWGLYYRRKAENGAMVAATFVLSFGAALLAALQQVSTGAMTVGDFVLINAYMLQIVKPLEALGMAFSQMIYGVTFTQKMVGLLAEPTEDVAAFAKGLPVQAKAPQGGGALTFERVSFAYGPERQTLADVSFKVEPGRTVGIVGGSGAGKSSLVRLLARLVEPDGGRILLDGVDIASLPLDALRSLVAVVPQDTVLFNQTLAFNIGVGRPGCSREEIESAAKAARIHDFILRQPQGYETIVGERGVKLSGGERQRIAIARAILRRPRIFIFDEATSALDTRTEREILRNLMEVSRGTTTLIIAHRLSTVVHADQIVVLEHGRVIETGTHAGLLATGGAYAELWKAQQRGHKKGAAAG
ncbi:ATP-binding cassette domain-containing protein [Pedomonas mirosovicensis]|uniref:ATP-binding cassette domain-containing protein n=1 Tax=Pedomonas mirosovicensis TaxID=2908641 RepID=UPI002166ED76|nr:ATP-binding cassette domain-containing protein [Pedomonas mirosovicensis]MCH8684501.1 ATP-binding cassette domain-containing protein [Pedomonas mirosovicensis]